MSDAETARENGWTTGTTLYGHPIVRDGVQVEGGKTAILTAVGLRSVLAITRLDNHDTWGSETMLTFTSRDWELVTYEDS